MQPIRREDIKDLTAYEQVRSEFAAGDGHTAPERFWEKVRPSSRIARPSSTRSRDDPRREDRRGVGIAHEIETYNETPAEVQSLAGTLFLELGRAEDPRRPGGVPGPDRGVCLLISNRGGSCAVRGRAERGRADLGAHYVQFLLEGNGEALETPRILQPSSSIRAIGPVLWWKWRWWPLDRGSQT
jgi:hypothetical protein